MARPLKKLPASQVMATVTRLRSRNNRYWSALWMEGLKTAKGRRAWKKIRETDIQVSKWMGRL